MGGGRVTTDQERIVVLESEIRDLRHRVERAEAMLIAVGDQLRALAAEKDKKR